MTTLVGKRWLPWVVLALLFAACSENGERAAARFELLAQVPAETPYVFAAGRPLPDAVSRHFLKTLALGEADRGIRIANRVAQAKGPDQARPWRLLAALEAELEGRLTPEGLASLGFPLSGRSLLYGLGPLPVLWLEIEDPQRVEALLDRVEARAQEPAQRLEAQGLAYRRWAFGKLVAVAAVRDRYLVLAVLPQAAETELLPLALGLIRPERSLADTGAFREFVAGRGYQGHGDGYLDLARWVALMLGEAGGVNARVAKALGLKPAVAGEACRELARHLVGAVPRIAVGYLQASETGYTLEAALETSPAVGRWLERLAAFVPGLGADEAAIFSVGLALDLPTLRDALRAAFNDILARGEGCEHVDAAALTSAMQSLELALNPMVAGIRGVNLTLEEIELDAETRAPRSARGRLLISTVDPRGLLGMAVVLDPRVATLQVPADGTPVLLPLSGVTSAVPLWVAVRGEVLGLFAGEQKPEDAARRLQAPPADPHLLFVLDYDVGKLLARVGPSLEEAVQGAAGAEAEETRAFYRAVEETARLYRRIRVEVLGLKRGLTLRTTVRFDPEPPRP